MGSGLVILAAAACLAGQAPADGATPTLRPCPACDAAVMFEAAHLDAPVWTGPDQVERYEALLAAVEGAADHGLDPRLYQLDALRAGDPSRPDARLDRLATRAYLTLASHLRDGRLDPARFGRDPGAPMGAAALAAHLEAALASGRIAESLEALAPPQDGYARLREALALYRQLAEAGPGPVIPPGPILHPGDRDERVPALRARLIPPVPPSADETGQTEPDEGAPENGGPDAADPLIYDAALAEAVRAFQTRSGLEADALVGERTLALLNLSAADRAARIAVNLERWRWLPDDLGARHIRVNVPAFSLEAVDGGAVRRHAVIVGTTARPTPSFSAALGYLVVNPWWETPHRLAVLDKLPAFQRDPGQVERLGFQVLDDAGLPVDPATIDWTALTPDDFPYRLRQAPGPLNALGQVKFIFPNVHSVFIHDTPNRELFDRPRRAFSSGCVRVSDALALAEWTLEDTPDWSAERLDGAVTGAAETVAILAAPIPVHIAYFTVEADEEGGVRFFDDLYDRDGGVLAALRDGAPPLETP